MAIVEREPVREFTGDHHRLAMTLMQMLQAQRDQAAALLVKKSAKDYADYTNACGRIDGLDIAISLCKQQQERLQG